MAIIEIPFPFLSDSCAIRSSRGVKLINNRRGRWLRGPRARLRKKPGPHDERLKIAWEHPSYPPNTVVSPCGWEDQCTYFSMADQFYSRRRKWFKANWHREVMSRWMSTYDAWMAQALRHFTVGLSKTRYPIQTPGFTIRAYEGDPYLLYPGESEENFLVYPDSYSARGVHHIDIEAREVYFEGPFPPYGSPPNPVEHHHLGFESRISVDCLFSYNPHPQYFSALPYPDRTRGFAVLEAYDLNAPHGYMAGTAYSDILPYHTKPVLSPFRPEFFCVLFCPPIRNSAHEIVSMEPDLEKTAKFFWIKTSRPWARPPQLRPLRKGDFTPHFQPWGPFIDYGHYVIAGYDLPDEDCHYGYHV